MKAKVPAADLAYRRRLERVRMGLQLVAAHTFNATIDPKDIIGSFDKVVAEVVPLIETGQEIGQEMAADYIGSILEAAALPDETPGVPIPIDLDNVGTNSKGQPLAEALAAIGPMILTRIAENGGAPQALGAQAALARLRAAPTLDGR